MNRRDPRLFDIYALDPRTGQTRSTRRIPATICGYAGDAAMVVRAGIVQHADASSEFLVRDDAAAPWRTLARFSADDGMPRTVGFTPDGRGLLAITSADANAARLVRYDVASGGVRRRRRSAVRRHRRRVLAARPRRRRCGGRPRPLEWIVLDPAYDARLRGAARAGSRRSRRRLDRPRRPPLARRRRCRRRFAVVLALRSRDAARATMLFATRPALERYTLATMRRSPYRGPRRAHDPRLPHAASPAPARGLPAVLLVHGGPWARDTWGYNPYRAMAREPRLRRAAAELSRLDRLRQGAPQRRRPRVGRHDAHRSARRKGLAGRAGHRRRRARRDHGRFVRRLRDARRARVRARAFACGIDIVGPSNLNTLLASIPPYWETLRAHVHAAHGRGRSVPDRAVAAVQGRRDSRAAADRSRRERPAREDRRVRPDRRGDAHATASR